MSFIQWSARERRGIKKAPANEQAGARDIAKIYARAIFAGVAFTGDWTGVF
jgi:hypothetical protein